MSASVTHDLASLLPDEVEGYLPDGPDGVFNRDNLFSLINGGAEVYRSLNVDKVLSRRYTRKGSGEILVDLFDMGSPEDAFGAYHHDMREGEKAGVGQESEYQGGSLYFWKGRYFVSVVSLRKGEDTRKVVLAFGRAVAGGIHNAGKPPDLLELLPGEGLNIAQVHYFHDWNLLNRHFFLGDENLLKLGKETEGILARYRSLVVLVIRYPSEGKAKQAGKDFAQVHLGKPDEQGLARQESGKWAGFRVSGDRVFVVLDAASRDKALGMLGKTGEKAP